MIDPGAPTPQDPRGRQAADIAALEQRLTAVERMRAGTLELEGPRSDLAGGRGVRVRVGLLSDGTYGIERYSSTGVRTTPTWS